MLFTNENFEYYDKAIQHLSRYSDLQCVETKAMAYYYIGNIH